MKGPIARATYRTTAVLGLRLIAQSGTLLVVARLLGPARFGAFAGVAALAVLLGALSNFGTHLVLLREVSIEQERRDGVLPYALGATLSCGALLLLLFSALTFTLLHHLGIDISSALCIGAAELILQPLLALSAAEHQARGHIAGSQLLTALPPILRLCAALLLWQYQPAEPLHAYAIGYLGASALALVIGIRSLEARWPHWSQFRLPRHTEWVGASGFAVLNISALGPNELDKILASRLMPLALAGVYAASARAASALVLPVMALMLAALPRLFRETGSARGALLLRAIFMSSATYGAAAATLLWLIAPAVEMLFGMKYQGTSLTMRWLTIAVPAMALRTAAGNALMAQSRPWVRNAYETFGVVTLALAACILVPDLPLAGMPLALACSEWSMAIIGWLVLKWFTHHRPFEDPA